MNDMKKKIMTMAMMAFAFTACTEEDLMQPTQGDAGTLHIASVTIDGQEVARSRVVADGGTYAMNELPYNQSINGFIKGDALQLTMTNTTPRSAYAIYNGTTWTLTSDNAGTNPVTIQPAEGKKWADVGIEAAFGGNQLSGNSNDYTTTAAAMGVVQGDIDVRYSLILGDWLVPSTGNGVTIDTDVKSPTLGAVTIQLKHAHALLRLPKSAAGIEEDTYIVNGTAHKVTGLGTLWAVVKNGSDIQYFPLTKVTIDRTDYLQAIVPADTEGIYTLTGFKAVINTSEGGKTVTIDLPFKVGTETSLKFQPNYRYPLTLNIAPHTASVSLSGGLGKPGWGTVEEELKNEPKYRDDLIYVPTDTEGNTYPYFKVLKPSGMPDLIKWMNGEDINLDNVQYIPDDLKYAQEPTDEERLTESITLDCDLDYSSVETTKFQVGGENFEYNFIPLGHSDITASGASNQLKYTGLFDGKNKTITGVKMILPVSEVGIIGWLDGEGSGIKNLNIVGATIQGDGSVGAAVGYADGGTISGITVDNTSSILAKGNYGSDVGGIAGFASETTVENCSNAASVKGLGIVGGIVGYTGSGSIIRRCTNSGDIEMTHLYTVGGITALASGGSYVMACTNTGTVSDTSPDVTSNNDAYLGGIVGDNSGVVLLCNNTGKINNVENAHVEFLGGIVGSHSGFNQSTFINQGFLGGCWTTFGKTIGDIENTMFPHTYYNFTTDVTHSDEDDYVASVNTDALVDEMNSGVAFFNSHKDYPDCGYKWQTGTGAPVMVEGTPSITYLMEYTNNKIAVKSAKELQIVADLINDNMDKAMASLYIENLPTDLSYSDQVAISIDITDDIALDPGRLLYDLDGNGTKESNWEPLGRGSDYRGKIVGVKSGGGTPTISGLRMKVASSKYDMNDINTNVSAGFVQLLYTGGLIKNLNFTDATITGGSGSCSGVVAAYSVGTIEGCSVTGTTSSPVSITAGYDGSLGGIVGINKGSIHQCTVSGISLSGGYYQGGIVGEGYSASLVTASVANGNSFTDGTQIGGIAGYASSSMVACATDATALAGRISNMDFIACWIAGTTTSAIIDSAYIGCYNMASGNATAETDAVTAMNNALATYNATEGNTAVAFHWEAQSGAWPKLVAGAPTAPAP